jgi:hypothetical protein
MHASSEPDMPVLIVGDVHGDLERLFQALKPYPATEWRTIFLGDLIDYGPCGVGALRYARDRANSVVLLGNHEVAMLWALRDPARVGFWIGIGGQDHDLKELANDPALQHWLRERPALLRLRDGTIVQHCGSDSYALLLDKEAPDPIAAINARVHELLVGGGEAQLWDLMSGKNIFPAQPLRLDQWLELTGSRRVIFGHNPHRNSGPEVYHGGQAINFDGAFSRFHSKFQRRSPLGGSVAPLPD